MVVNKNIILEKYGWSSCGNVSVTGFVWVNMQLLNGPNLAAYLAQHADSSDAFREFLKRLDGQFSVVVLKGGEIWVACGHTWSFPVFYCRVENQIFISDNPEKLVDKLKVPRIDQMAQNYFLLLGVTHGNKTLIENISQVKAGEMLLLKDDWTKSVSIFEEPGKVPLAVSSEKSLQQTIVSSFEKYADYLKGKQVLLPLTKGYDSRLLACLLKMWGHENVICATWGRAGNTEIETARNVAGQLGYKYIFVEYNSALISGFSKEQQFLDYVDFAGHISSMPFAQDYFALKYLLKNQIISTDTVVLPGHSGDTIAGSHLDFQIENADNKHLLTKITEKYSSTYPLKPKALKEVENAITADFFQDEELKAWQKFENWDFHERQCKLIANSNQLYAHLGMMVLMPLFDKNFIGFFNQLPFAQKLNVKLYNATLEKYFFEPLQVNFNLKRPLTRIRNSESTKKLILNFTPRWIKKMYYPMRDSIYYREITSELIRSLPKKAFNHPKKPHFYNSYLIQWYLNRVQGKIQ